MKAIVKAVLRWPMYSIPRLMLTAVALVVVFVAAQYVGGSGDEDSPVESAAVSSDAGGTSDGGGTSDAGGGTQQGAQEAGRQALRALVTRDSPADLSWTAAMRPYVTSALLQDWQEEPWDHASGAPFTVAAVSVRDASDGAVVTETTWEGVMDVTAVDGSGEEHTFSFRVHVERSENGWKVSKLDEVVA